MQKACKTVAKLVDTWIQLTDVGGRKTLTQGHAASGGALSPKLPRAHWIGPEQGKIFAKQDKKIVHKKNGLPCPFCQN